MNFPSLRLVFMGTPELARTILVALAGAPWARLEAVVSQPDRPAGRHLQPTPPPVKLEAERLGYPVWQPLKARDPQFLEQLRQLAPDLIVVAAYGQLLPAALLEIPRLGCLNVHTSLLPRWRGAAPIQWAIASGDSETGVTLMKMDVGLDTGPTLGVLRTPILAEDTSQTLHDRLATLGAQVLMDLVPEYAAGNLLPQAQASEGVTLARKITREDGRLDWTQPSQVLLNRLHAFTPWPGSHCFLPADPKPRLLKVHRAQKAPLTISARPGEIVSQSPAGLRVACGEDALVLTEVQMEGGRRLTAAEFLTGHSLTHLE